ncbi:MAG: HU family DNA-binding protein [Steroidobacteraceae bacterium]
MERRAAAAPILCTRRAESGCFTAGWREKGSAKTTGSGPRPGLPRSSRQRGAKKPFEKSGFRTGGRKKNSCAGVRMCYFPRRFVIARLHNSAHVQILEEWRNMAKKGSAPTKSEVLTQISKDTGLSRKQVGSVFDSLNGVIKKSLRSNGLFTMPGLLKMKVVKKPATKAREGINPFTGENMMFKAKPASKKVRVMPLKNLKAMVNS